MPQTSGQSSDLMQWNIKPPASEAAETSIDVETNSSGILSSDDADDLSSMEDKPSGNIKAVFSMDLFKHQRRPAREVSVDDLLPSSPFRFLSPHPLGLSPLQSLFLDHYLSNFSLKYPTYLDPSNPFLSTLVPLALRSTTVLCAVLAIGGIQTGLEGGADVKAEILALKGRTLRGCRKLLQRSSVSKVSDGHLLASPEQHSFGSAFLVQSGSGMPQDRCEEDDLMLFASVMMLMVHDKLSGEPCSNLRPHLKFAHHFERRPVFHQVSVHHKFLRNIFLYNDLLAAISSGSPTLRDYGQNTANDQDTPLNEDGSSMDKLTSNRYYLPILLSRIANGANRVALADIERWDGNMTWLPSFSSTEIGEVNSTIEHQPPSTPIADESENVLISEIYRNATRVLYYQRLRNKSKELLDKSTFTMSGSPGFGDDPSYEFQIQHFNSILLANLRSLPLGSAYESSLLFPIGIAAMEIRDIGEKAYVLSRLQLLEDRFQLNHFRKFREKLSTFWEGSENQIIGQQFACDAILLG